MEATVSSSSIPTVNTLLSYAKITEEEAMSTRSITDVTWNPKISPTNHCTSLDFHSPIIPQLQKICRRTRIQPPEKKKNTSETITTTTTTTTTTSLTEEGIPHSLRGSLWITIAALTRNEFNHDARLMGQLDRIPILNSSYIQILTQMWGEPEERTFLNSQVQEEKQVVFFPWYFPSWNEKDSLANTDFTNFVLFTQEGQMGEEHVSHILSHDLSQNRTIRVQRNISFPMQRILSSIASRRNVSYSPMLPDITAILLTTMSEAHAYRTLQFLLQSESPQSGKSIAKSSHIDRYQIPTTVEEHLLLCQSFIHLFSLYYPKTAQVFLQEGSGTTLTPQGLDPFFRRFFVNVFQYPHVLLFMDLFLLDGMKALFRIGFTLLQSSFENSNRHSSSLSSSSSSQEENRWNIIRSYTHSPTFQWKNLIRLAYQKKWRRFPHRRQIDKVMTHYQNIDWTTQYLNDSSILQRDVQQQQDILTHLLQRPMGYVDTLRTHSMTKNRTNGVSTGKNIFVTPNDSSSSSSTTKNELIPAQIIKSRSIRSQLARWMPPILQECQLEMIYSTTMGRTLDTFYQHVDTNKHTLILMEVLNNHSLIGIYTSQPWKVSPRSYGDGQCFFFRLSPEPICFKWIPSSPHESVPNQNRHHASSARVQSSLEMTSLQEQFMVAKRDFIALGGSADGGFGLRLNEDLSKGYSRQAVGYKNEPLPGDNLQEFNIGLVEVYRFIQEISGNPVS